MYNSNITLVLNDVDIADDYVVSNTIFKNSDRNDKMKDYTLVPSTVSSRSISSSSSNKSKNFYSDWMQRKNNKMVQDKSTAIFDSFQLEYTIPERQNLNISKVADTPPNMNIKHVHNAAPTYVNSTIDNINDVINI